MSRRLIEQFAIFYFAINDVPAADSEYHEPSYDVWKAANHLLEKRQRVHPHRTFTEGNDPYALTYERWELCEQSPEVESRQGLMAWPVSFHSHSAFDAETLKILRDMCLECFTEAASASSLDGGAARFIEATTQSVYQENVTVLVEGLE
jgi:hypothetical protein